MRINLKSEHKEREGEKNRKIWTFNLVLSFAVEKIQAKPACKGVEASLEPSHSRTDGPGDLAGNKSQCHSAKTELPLDLQPCSTHVGPWVSLSSV